jgi:tRNA U34 5-carboxymethylaminomethyl modifying GTPase MnmE/TrmE
MIEVVKQIEEDWYLIHLTGTTYYQIWNKNDFHETLLEAGYIKLGKQQKCTTIWYDNEPNIDELTEKLNQIKNEKN